MKRVIVFLTVFAYMTGCGGMYVAPVAYAAEHAAKGKKKGGTEDPNAPHADFEYFQLDPLVLPIITDKGVTQQVNLLISLEVPFGKIEDISLFKPRLADAYLQDLYGAFGAGHGLMMRGNVLDLVKIKKRLTLVTDKVLGPEHKINDVLLQVVQQRSL
jgi:hypothetical protein